MALDATASDGRKPGNINTTPTSLVRVERLCAELAGRR